MTERRTLIGAAGVAAIVALVASVLFFSGGGSERVDAVELTVIPTGIAVAAEHAPNYPDIAEPAEDAAHAGVPYGSAAEGTRELTLEDLQAYLDEFPHPYAREGTSPVVTDFGCATIGEINTRLHSNMPVPEATRACLVTFAGDFVHVAASDAEPITGDVGYQVFDAVTGTLYSTQFKNSAIHPIP